MVLNNFYSVVKTENKENEIITEILINKSHEIYNGHFPGRPVTPGVILMELFKEEAERQTNCKLVLESANNVKFTSVVDPNQGEHFFLYTKILKEDGLVKLKGLAKHNNVIALKINSVYALKT